MIGAISNNGMIAALFGPGALRVRGVPAASREQASTTVSGVTPSPAQAEPEDVVEISLGTGNASRDIATKAGEHAASGTTRLQVSGSDPPAPAAGKQLDGGGQATSVGSQELTPEEQDQVRELKQRDAEVRRHEQAHKAAAGSFAKGGPSFEYQTGPDGDRYAVGGEVSIDTSAVAGDPQATIRKMQQVRRAASAPANPSGQDRAVAAQALAAEQQARTDLTALQNEGQGVSASNATGASPGASTPDAGGVNEQRPGTTGSSASNPAPARGSQLSAFDFSHSTGSMLDLVA